MLGWEGGGGYYLKINTVCNFDQINSICVVQYELF